MSKPIHLSTLTYFEPIQGLKSKLVHTDSQTFAFWEIDKGTLLPAHQHMHEQVSFVTKGELELSINGDITIMKKGMCMVIPPNTVHSARAITQVELTDVFTPCREDFPQ